MQKGLVVFKFLVSTLVLDAQPFALDTTFQSEHEFRNGSNLQYIGNILSLLEENNGSVLVVGEFKYDNNDIRINTIRLYEDGQIDQSWAPDVYLTENVWEVQKVNDLYYFTYHYLGITRSTHTGHFIDSGLIPLDTNFSGGTNYPFVFPDGSILTGGDGGMYPSSNNFQRRLYFMRIKPNGWIDSSFYHNTNFDVEKTIRYDSTRMLVYGGWMTHYDSIAVNKICRIDTAGNLDTTFQTNIFDWGSPRPQYVQPDGKIIVGGWFTLNNHGDILSIVRLNPDGSLDSSFNNFNSVVGLESVNAVCPTSDGGFLIGGSFTTYQGYPRKRIVKTDADGFIDLNYFNGEAIDSAKNSLSYTAEVLNIIPAQNDKYYVMGHFLKYDGQVVRPLIRILGLSHTVGVEAVPPPQVRVYPNPAAGDVRVEWELPPGSRPAEIRIRDIQGREVARQTVSTQEGQWLWDTRNVPDGIYLYELRTEAQEVLVQGKIVVQK